MEPETNDFETIDRLLKDIEKITGKYVHSEYETNVALIMRLIRDIQTSLDDILDK